MSGRSGRTETCSKAEARNRLNHAHAFVDTAELVLGTDDDASENVAAALAVLAGIAACDAVCCVRLGKRARGPNHREAVDLLATVAEVGPNMGKDLARLLEVRDNAHYGIYYLTRAKATQTLTWAKRLVTTADSVVHG
jgi:hypothetical protein